MFEDRKLERQLKARRPEPNDEFVRRLSAQIPAPSPARSGMRLAVALAVATATVIVAGATGGLGYAAGAVGGASSSVASTFRDLAGSNPRPATSSSFAANSVAAASTQYTATGYYCFKKTNRGTTIYKETYVSSDAEFQSQSNGGFTAVAYYPSAEGPCGPPL